MGRQRSWRNGPCCCPRNPRSDGRAAAQKCCNLLDNTLVFAHSDVSYAKNHDVLGIPVMLAGRAGGKVKSGIHVHGNGESISRVGLTLQQLMGISVDSWGMDAMNTKRPIGEILA